MRYLLDTHIILWALVDDDKIEPFRGLIADPRNEIYFSSASIWEIAIKHEKGSLDFDLKEVEDACVMQGYMPMHMTAEHAIGTSDLRYPEGETPHKDPFDRMLIAQAKSEGLMLLTVDEKILKYTEPCIYRL